MKLQVLTWSPSRYAKWKECPSKVLYEDLQKMCPVCFKGRISGGFNGDPVICDTCTKPQPERGPLDRGNRLDAALTSELLNRPMTAEEVSKAKTVAEREAFDAAYQASVAEATRHPFIAAMVKKLRAVKNKFPQFKAVLDKGWTASPRGVYTKNAWARLTLDLLVVRPKKLEVIDWKSGNIDKRTGQIRERAEYHDSMRMYQAAALSLHPKAQEASAQMVFLDAPPKLADPTKSLPVLKRKDLPSVKADIERKLEPMFNDTTFAPKPGMQCTWCAFSKDKGGPCKFSGGGQ